MSLLAVVVALLTEGVDRNGSLYLGNDIGKMSPSSRRAWIEIMLHGCGDNSVWVALLAEGVDRNRLPVALDLCRECRPPRGGRG